MKFTSVLKRLMFGSGLPNRGAQRFRFVRQKAKQNSRQVGWRNTTFSKCLFYGNDVNHASRSGDGRAALRTESCIGLNPVLTSRAVNPEPFRISLFHGISFCCQRRQALTIAVAQQNPGSTPPIFGSRVVLSFGDLRNFVKIKRLAR